MARLIFTPQVLHFFCHTYVIFYRSIWLNLPGMASIITIACLAGVVIYAFYATCDPLTFGLVDKADQVYMHA